MRPYQRLVAFIDWNSQLIAMGVRGSDAATTAEYVLARISARTARALSRLFANQRFVVDLRFYHGWHKGFEPTVNRKAIAQAIAKADFATLSPRQNVVFSGDAKYGDHLVSALPERLHQRLAIHLPNTLRSQDRRRELTEKMVDTALAADLVASAAKDPDAWLLVIAEDDDMVPPLFAAEALLSNSQARALLLRSRAQTGPFLKLDGILCEEL